MASSPITSWQIDGEKVETVADFNFLGYKITANSDYSHKIKRCLLLGRKTLTNLDSILKRKQRHHLAKYGPYSQSYGFSSSHVRMWELDHTEVWEPKIWCFWTVMLEKTLESPWTARRSNQLILKEINPEYSLEGLVVKLKLQYFGHQLIRNDSDAGKDWRQEKKGETEDEMIGWHHQLHGHEFEKTLGDCEGQGSLVCCIPWGCKELDMIYRLNKQAKII